MDGSRRYGRVYNRRRNRSSGADVPTENMPEIHRFNGIRRCRTPRARRTNYYHLTNIFNRGISTNSPTSTNVLIDIPVQLERQRRNKRVRTRRLSQIYNNSMVEVPIEVVHAVPEISNSHIQTPISNSHIQKRRRPEDDEILRAPLGTFAAPASTSTTRKKPRTTRSRRAQLSPIIFPQLPAPPSDNDRIIHRRIANRIRQRRFYERQMAENRSTFRALCTARQRARRARDRARRPNFENQPLLSQTAKNTIRQRKYRASQTVERRIVARAINTVRRRNSRLRLSQQMPTSNIVPQTTPSNAQHFRNAIHDISWGWCLECKTRFPDMSSTGLCDFCKKDKEKYPEGSLFSAANTMDPGDVPVELSRLTDLESLLIARVHPMMSVYRVKGQQYKYSGNVINFAQDVNAIAYDLPYKPADLTAILIVKRTGSNTTKEFVVRREYVRQALVWLQKNHLYYKNITINDGNIANLPEDSVPDNLPNVDEDIHPQGNGSHQGNHPEEDDNNGPPELQEQDFRVDQFQVAGTVATAVQPNQRRCIRRALQMAEADTTTAHMPFTGEVIDEFSREGYITMAFPTLFPYGTADLRQPRLRKVHASQYFQHLMRYHDGRFARDSRFRYFAWNSITRWRALSLGDVYVNNNPRDGELSIEALRNMVSSGDNRLAYRVSYYAKQIRGTRAYWYTRLKELIAMVNQLGPPTIFFTLSAADLQWPELYTLLDPSNAWQRLNPNEQRREKARLLNENPLLAAWFFQKRVQLFFKHFLKNEFSVIDYWYRFEWQNRGSGHVHGFLWLNDGPNVSEIATNEQVRRAVCQYFDTMVCTTNPDPTNSNSMQEHPCAKKIPLQARLDEDDDDYASLVNCVMRHSKCGSYCLRKSKTTRQMVCRFKFPFEIQHDSKIIEEPPNSNMFRYMGKRNDQYVNSHNRQVAQTWRANIDWSAVLSSTAVVYYIGKYAAKAEPASKNYKDILRDIVDDERRPCRDSASAIKRLLIKNASERDISAQEVCHLLMGYHLTESSRKVVLLNLNENSLFSGQLRRRRNNQSGEDLGTDPSFFGRYLQRPDTFENTSLLTMAKKHYYARQRWCTYKKDAVVRTLPEVDGNILPNTDKWESFCRQRVLLNHHYRSIDEAKGGFQLWSERYSDLGYDTQNQSINTDLLDDDLEDDDEHQDNQIEEWMLAAAMGPDHAPMQTIDLGLRTHDLNHNWSEGLTKYPNINEDRRFTSTLLHSEAQVNIETPGVSIEDLSQEQRIAHDLVLSSLQSKSTIRLIISGGAGTGKSTLINAIVHSTRELFQNIKSVRIMAPTGVAAFNIGGATLHHELAIPADRNQPCKPLEGDFGGRMQEDFKDTRLIVIDEYSMIGRKMFANVNQRCKDLFTSKEPFGNMSIVLVGDMRQLPPVFDSPLYIQGGDPMQLQGALSYSSFEYCVQLSQVFRQSGNEQSLFRDALLRLSDGKSTPQDWNLFKTRDFSMFTAEEITHFKYAVRLFPTKDAAAEYNHRRLEDLGNPIARITSKNNCETARNARSDEAKGLQNFLLLSKGARVMLRANLSTRYGLVNGARGIVVDIVYAEGDTSPTHIPVAVMVDFDKYTGPKLYPERNIVPIVPQTTNWKTSSGISCQRTQLPLILCWAMTVHKSQGLTLDQAVVDIGERESLGMTFVALSRTRTLKDLAFSPMFTYERIKRIGQCAGLPKRRKEEDRLQLLSSNTLTCLHAN